MQNADQDLEAGVDLICTLAREEVDQAKIQRAKDRVTDLRVMMKMGLIEKHSVEQEFKSMWDSLSEAETEPVLRWVYETGLDLVVEELGPASPYAMDLWEVVRIYIEGEPSAEPYLRNYLASGAHGDLHQYNSPLEPLPTPSVPWQPPVEREADEPREAAQLTWEDEKKVRKYKAACVAAQRHAEDMNLGLTLSAEEAFDRVAARDPEAGRYRAEVLG